MKCQICNLLYEEHSLTRDDALNIHKFGGYRNRCFLKTNFKGFEFKGKLTDERVIIKYNNITYPILRDAKGRPIIAKYSKKDEQISLRTGKVSNPYIKIVQEGQNKFDKLGNPIFLLDLDNPIPVHHPNGKSIIKSGIYIKKSLFKNSNFEKSDFSNTIFKSFLKKYNSRIIACNFSKTKWNGATLENVIFKDCNMRGVDMTNLKFFKNVAFINCNMRGSRIPDEMVLQNPINENLMDNSRKRSKSSIRKR